MDYAPRERNADLAVLVFERRNVLANLLYRDVVTPSGVGICEGVHRCRQRRRAKWSGGGKKERNELSRVEIGEDFQCNRDLHKSS